MFIQRIELENFANIYSGLGFHRLIIDFTNQTNTVCVITGENGRGKTSLLSYMTPFATLGNIDVRDSVRLIIPKEKGFKRIVLMNEKGDTFDIKHYYTPSKDTYTIKSYIEMNGKELNENGNVTSFKRLVADLLGIEMDYLKLIRMGDNITNLIKSKPTERKVFMGKILDEVDIFLKQHKEITQKQREVKAVLVRIIDELTKTGITDIDEARKELKKIEKEIISVTKQYEEANEKKTRILYDIEKIAFPSDGKYQIKDLEKELQGYEKVLSSVDEKSKDVKSLSKKIQDVEKQIVSIEASIEATSKMHEIAMGDLDNLFNTCHSIALEIEKEKDSLNLDSMRAYLVELRKKVNESYRTAYDEVKLGCTKEEYEDFVVFLKNTQLLLNTTYEFGKEPIKEVLKGMLKNQDIPNLITSSLVTLEAKERAEKMSILDKLIAKYSMEYACEDKGCPYLNLHKELMSIKDATPVNEVTKDEEFYQMMKLAYDNLSRIFDSFKDYQKTIEKLPDEIQKMFVIDTMFQNIGNGTIIYDEGIINKYLSFFTEVDNYRKLEEELKKQEEEVKRLESISKLSYLEDQLKENTEKSGEMKDRVIELKDALDEKSHALSSAKEELEMLTELQEAVEKYDSTKTSYNELLEKSEENTKKFEDLSVAEQRVNELKNWKDQLVNEKYKKESNITRFKQLTEDYDANKEMYDDYTQLEYALSNRTGIPLCYIDVYLRDTREIANELLDIVYDGEIYLEKFELKEDDFRFPYVKNGILIDDVSSSSQGEQSFFNMAISSALRVQRLSDYNIALFDEVDGAFDDSNRQKFIPVLERQLELGNIKQAFLITHNQMFQKYPVDRIDLDNIERSTVNVYGD